MSNHDKLYRYLFNHHAVRGELVSVNETYRQILANPNYPLPVQKLLGEMLVATCLLTATLKFEGDITVQLQSEGPLTLAVINGNNRQEMRGIAQVNGDILADCSLKGMLNNKGYLMITISPTQGESYQGVVELVGDTITECLENYFKQSEQLPTRLFICTCSVEGHAAAAGMLLQVLPSEAIEGHHKNEFEHLAQLTATIKAEELFTLPANEVLYRLYHQEDVTLYEPKNVSFRCVCSRERCARALDTLPIEEIQQMIEQDGHIDMHCDYCNSHYLFDAIDIAALQKGHRISSDPLH